MNSKHEDANFFPPELTEKAQRVIDLCSETKKRVATAESCTGGLVSACLTSLVGTGEALERGFVTYTKASKTAVLGVPDDLLAKKGAVCGDVARAMAEGAIRHSRADLAVSVTGLCGPGTDGEEEPVGTVFIGLARRGGGADARHFAFGDIGRDEVQRRSVAAALDLLAEALTREKT